MILKVGDFIRESGRPIGRAIGQIINIKGPTVQIKWYVSDLRQPFIETYEYIFLNQELKLKKIIHIPHSRLAEFILPRAIVKRKLYSKYASK